MLTISLAWAIGAVARLGLWLSIVPGPVAANWLAANWLAAGLALAALMVFGRRALAGLAIGLLAANWLQGVGSFGAFDAAAARVAILVTLGELAQALLAAWALRSLPRELPRNPVRQTLRYALTVALCGLVAASVGSFAWLGLAVAPHAEPLFGWVAGWLGDVAGMLVVTPVLLLLFHPRLRTDRLTVQPFPLICLGLGLTAFCTFAVGLSVRDAQTERFKADAGRLAMTLQTHVELTARDLETLQHYFYKIDVGPDEFRSVSTPLLARSPWQSTFAWLPRVTIALREAFESSPSGLDGTSIREIDPQGSVVRAGLRSDYFPVAWTDPAAGREALIGLDDSHDAQRGTALARAVAGHAMSSTPPLSTVANSPEGKLVQTLYAPVDNEAVSRLWPSDPGHVRGMVAATLDLAALLEASVAQMGTHDETLLLFDPDAPRSAALLWSAGRPLRIIEPAQRDDLTDRIDAGVSVRHEIRVADRRWTMLARPAWADAMPRPGWLQASVLASGLAFTALLTALLAARRRRDELLQDAREQLEVQVEARTHDLGETNARLRDEIEGHRRTEALLQDARQSAEAASRAKSQFLANMSHEIRTPLNAVLGYTQLLIKDRRQVPDARDRLRVIYAAGQRLLGLINDVLDLAKIEAGALQVHLAPIDLRRELGEVFSMFEPRAQAKGLALRLDIDLDDECGLVTDRAKFGQVVLNLLGNALKFTDTGHIALRAWRAGGDTLVEVEDSGPGMDADEMAGIFTAFRQGAAGLDKGGTGLGLNLSRHIAQALGGELTVASEKGRGTTVRLRLPMAQVDRAGVAAPALVGGQRLAPGSSLRVLVVEDDPHSRDVLVTLLRQTGCEVEAAVDGEAGLAACRARPDDAPFDIVFSDIRMPRLDGLQMLQALRADPRTRGLALVAVSASSLEHERRYYVERGFQDFVGKPYEFAAIHEMLVLHAGARLVAAPDDAHGVDVDPAAAVEACDRLQRDALAAAGAVRRSVLRAQLASLADGAATGSMRQVRERLATLAAAPPPSLPEGLLAQLEADLRQYDFTTLEARVRDALAADAASDDDDGHAFKGVTP
ncbi:ATP-binding protein [Scleromatobacter humisilvae]|uniref:histidine kinase n=1 Tax=Scleromatobacter humisilvae TaxID=2897159 RepID=A0A9X1YIG1_9BURK|nr:ATP-binding protein [Scleromatobacter humisilvae]MCK9685465.1 CHASE domain-containing protein [Scleromatobacter humisilvae]